MPYKSKRKDRAWHRRYMRLKRQAERSATPNRSYFNDANVTPDERGIVTPKQRKVVTPQSRKVIPSDWVEIGPPGSGEYIGPYPGD